MDAGVIGNWLRTFAALFLVLAVVPAIYVAAEWSKVDAAEKKLLGSEPELFAAIRDSDVARVGSILKDHPGALADRDPLGMTPLAYAAGDGQIEIVTLMLNKGADVDEPDRYGRTPLWWAAFWGRSEMIKLLSARGADVETADGRGVTPIAIAKDSGNAQAVRTLMARGAGRVVSAVELN